MRTKPIITDATSDSYFFELVQGAMQAQSVQVQPETEMYLVKLLSRFLVSEQLFPRDGSGNYQDQPIAFLYKEALETEQEESRTAMFRQVGDITLYKAGFFRESLETARIAVDYYVGIGGSAYQNVAVRADDRTAKNVFAELSGRFRTFVDLLFEVSSLTSAVPSSSEADVLRAYELWERTGSERAAKILEKSGITVTRKARDS
jgi:hypothetical protein